MIRVDKQDQYLLLKHTWTIKEAGRVNSKTGKLNSKKYAISWINKKLVRLHRIILNAPKNMDVDHINGNGLDNRRSNLRLCSHKNNCRNLISITGISKFKGVSKHQNTTKWRAYISINKKQKHLGYFESEIDAAKAYDKAAKEYFGDYARFNF